MKHNQTKRLLALSAAAVLSFGLLTACGGKSKSDEGAVLGPERSTTTEDKRPKSVLTGLVLEDKDLRERPLLTVKIDNHPQARPQFGIDQADVIVEEKVEGGLSRFMALYQSKDVDRVGPVRSLRSTDAKWLKPVGGMIAYSGGIAPFRNQLAPNGIADLGGDTYGPKYYKRRSDRPFEHSMYVNTEVMRELTPKSAKAPKALFSFLKSGETFGGSTATPVNSVSLRMGTGSQATFFDWTWNVEKGAFMRGTEGKAHQVEGQGQIAMKNVVIQFTSYSATPYRDRANSPVDEANVVGSGDAWILSDGKIVQGRWTRSGADQVTQYTDALGEVVKLQPGKSWVSLVPPAEPKEIR